MLYTDEGETVTAKVLQRWLAKLIVFASLVFSLHCEGPAAETRDLPTPLPTLSALGKDVRPKQRSFSLDSGKAPLLSLSTDEERFRLVLRANGWGDFSRRIEKLRELQITDVKTIEIELPLSACGFALPTSDARIHRCYYVEKSTNALSLIPRILAATTSFSFMTSPQHEAGLAPFAAS